MAVPAPAQANASAMRAMSNGNYRDAQKILREALSQSPNNLSLWLNLAGSCRALGDYSAAATAIESALRIAPRSFQAILMKATLLDRDGKRQQAAQLFGIASELAPADEALDPATLNALSHGRDVFGKYQRELGDFIEHEVADFRDRGSSDISLRMSTFTNLVTGKYRRFRQQPTQFFYPGLQEIEFYDRELFPWMDQLEAATDLIREEMENLLRDASDGFTPYVNYPDNVPLDQWGSLNRSPRWSALHLYHYGEAIEPYRSQCPQTMKSLAPIPQPWVKGLSPTAMFSALQPQTRIPPHTGVANTRLVMHLPLTIPEGCGFRVGNQTRPWVEGKAWVFDDTIEHEAWNQSAELRVILICDLWNPALSEIERQLIATVMTAKDRFDGGLPKEGL